MSYEKLLQNNFYFGIALGYIILYTLYLKTQGNPLNNAVENSCDKLPIKNITHFALRLEPYRRSEHNQEVNQNYIRAFTELYEHLCMEEKEQRIKVVRCLLF